MDLGLVRQLTHAVRAVRSRATRFALVREENHGARNKDDSGEHPVRKKRNKSSKPSSYTKKSGKKSAEKASVSKEAPKKKSKDKKRRSNAKSRQD